jgi:hypothetical protein
LGLWIYLFVASLDFQPNPNGGSTGETRKMRRRLQRVDGRSRPARRIKTLVKAFRKAMGAAAFEPFMAEKLQSLAEMETLTSEIRAAALRGRVALRLHIIRHGFSPLCRLRASPA